MMVEVVYAVSGFILMAGKCYPESEGEMNEMLQRIEKRYRI